MHLQMRLYRLCLHGIEELREILAEATVVLGPHQQIDRAETVLLGEEIKHIRFAIHDRDRKYAVELVSELSALLQAAQPAVCLALLKRLVLFRLAVGGLILDVRNPRVKVQAFQLQKWYRTFDALLPLKAALEEHLFGRFRHLFAPHCDLVFYDLTSTYLEGLGPEELAQHGYSRDQRPRNPQLLVGVAMVDGLPVSHTVFAGNRRDSTTVREVLADLRKRFGLGRFVFVGDRGMKSAASVAARAYQELWRVEAAFRSMKDVLELRPIWRRTDERVQAHVLVATLALTFDRILQRKLEKAGLRLSSRAAWEALEAVNLVEFEMPGRPRKAGICVNGEEGGHGNEARKVLRALGVALEAPQPPKTGTESSVPLRRPGPPRGTRPASGLPLQT